MLKIVVNKPSAGGERGHLCATCKYSDRVSGPGWERNRCTSFGEITRQVTDCSCYKAQDECRTVQDAPNAILNAAKYFVEYNGEFFCLSYSQFDAFDGTYDDEKREKMMRKWGFLRDE